MKQDLRVWVALLGLAMLVVSAAPASAIAYTPGTWQVFTTTFDTPAAYPDYFGTGYAPWGGMTTFGDYPDNDPFTFHLSSASTLKITDIFETGDFFACWDNGIILTGTTSSDWVYGGTEMDPDAAYAMGGLGGATYSTSLKPPSPYAPILGVGDHSLVFQNFFFKDGDPNPQGGTEGPMNWADGYFRVDPVPEPGTMALLGLGLAFAGLVIRRKR